MSRRLSIWLLIASNILLPYEISALPDEERSSLVLGSATQARIWRRNNQGYTDPKASGGYMLTIVNGTYPAGLGEPLNVILSAQSAPDLLKDAADGGGFLNYMLSTNLGQECLGQHLGADQAANLGDNQGNKSEVEELRWNFGNPYVGTCQETFQGGLHLRYWIQNTTGAYFMAVSVEMSAVEEHDIIPNGYDLGRDYLVGNLTSHPIPPRTVSNQSVVIGTTAYNNYTYQTSVQYVSNLMENSSAGVNHYLTVSEDGYPAIDGLVAILTVQITERPQGSALSMTVSRLSLLASVLVTFPLLLML